MEYNNNMYCYGTLQIILILSLNKYLLSMHISKHTIQKIFKLITNSIINEKCAISYELLMTS